MSSLLYYSISSDLTRDERIEIDKQVVKNREETKRLIIVISLTSLIYFSSLESVEAIHIYDLDEQVIAVFKKSTGKFVTTCQLDRDEHNELLETGNFGGGEGWFSGQVKNLPPEQTAVNTFESDVTGMTPIDNSEFDNR